MSAAPRRSTNFETWLAGISGSLSLIVLGMMAACFYTHDPALIRATKAIGLVVIGIVWAPPLVVLVYFGVERLREKRP